MRLRTLSDLLLQRQAIASWTALGVARHLNVQIKNEKSTLRGSDDRNLEQLKVGKADDAGLNFEGLQLAFEGRRTLFLQRWLLNKFAFEKVIPVRLQMIEDFLKITDIPGLWKLQRVDGLEENPLCVGGDWWNVRSRHVRREGKGAAVTLVSKKIDVHRPASAQNVYDETRL